MAGDGGRWRETAACSSCRGEGCAWAGVCVGRGGRGGQRGAEGGGSGGGCLVGQVAPVEVRPSIVVRVHLRPRVRGGQRWGV